MQTAGLTMNDVWAQRVLSDHGIEAYQLEGAPAEISVLIDDVELQHHGPDQHYRPFLKLSGELKSIRFGAGMPYDLTELTYGSGDERVTAFYEFSHEQLTTMTNKGYFASSFQVPAQLSGIEWQLPATVDVLLLPPQDEHTPVAFASVRNAADLQYDVDNSGYELSEYFPDVLRQPVDRPEQKLEARLVEARMEAVNSLFTEAELDLAADAVATAPDQEAEAGESLPASAQQLQQIEAEIAAESEAVAAAQAAEEGSPEQLYHDRIKGLFTESAPSVTADEREPRRATTPNTPTKPTPRPQPAPSSFDSLFAQEDDDFELG